MSRKPKWRQGEYTPKNPSKYSGKLPIMLKSSWEFKFAGFCDDNPHIKSWAYESIRVPYSHPIKRTPDGRAKGAIYIPDFLISYVDSHGRTITEMIEIKPASQSFLTEKSSKHDRIAIELNKAKWKAAVKWCRMKGISFRILTREEIYSK